MSDVFPFLIWFSLSLGASQDATLDHWVAPKPQPEAWYQSTLKSSDKTPIGVYLRGQFDPKPNEIRPSVIEHIFEADTLVVTTLYFARLTPAESKRVFNGWLQYEFGPRPPPPSATYQAKGRFTTYYVTPKATWKWVTDDEKLIARVSSNQRVPTALAEAVGLGATLSQDFGQSTRTVSSYGQIHSQLLKGKAQLPQLRALLKDKQLPPLMKVDVELVVAMLLSAQFKNQASDKISPTCDRTLLDEAVRLAPSLNADIQKLRTQCRVPQ